MKFNLNQVGVFKFNVSKIYAIIHKNNDEMIYLADDVNIPILKYSDYIMYDTVDSINDYINAKIVVYNMVIDYLKKTYAVEDGMIQLGAVTYHSDLDDREHVFDYHMVSTGDNDILVEENDRTYIIYEWELMRNCQTFKIDIVNYNKVLKQRFDVISAYHDPIVWSNALAFKPLNYVV
jgi:hypothetical protein